jgi:hypothetical protein
MCGINNTKFTRFYITEDNVILLFTNMNLKYHMRYIAKFWMQTRKGRNYFGPFCIPGRIILKQSSNTLAGKM